MRRFIVLVCAAIALSACGGPSEADIQATVGAAVQATTQAGQIATSVQATQEAGACDKPVLSVYADAAEKQIDIFKQQSSLVSSTPRASLGAPLQRLLDIQTETDKMTVPSCAKDFHTRLIKTMQLYQVAYQMFAAQQGSDTVINTTIEIAAQDMADITRDLKVVRDGSVPPSPTPRPTPKP